MTKDVELPCKDCLIYPLCKAQVNEYMNNNSGYAYKSISRPLANYIIYQEVLRPKCSIISNWVDIYKENLLEHIELIGILFLPKI